jgi:taurine dioxygenase
MTATAATQDLLRKHPRRRSLSGHRVRQHSIKVGICTPAIAAELGNISLADAALDLLRNWDSPCIR